MVLEVVGMPRKISEDILMETERKLKKLKVPTKKSKRQYTKKEVLQQLTPTIKTLHKKGFSYLEIAQEITNKSEGEIKTSERDVKKILDPSDTPPSDSMIPDTASLEESQN